jgi:hypothetical protein
MPLVDAAKANAGLALFILSGPALTVVNKAILDTGFRHPVIVSGFGMAGTTIFTQLLFATGRLHVQERPPNFWLRNCVPVGATAMATMGFGNAACESQVESKSMHPPARGPTSPWRTGKHDVHTKTRLTNVVLLLRSDLYLNLSFIQMLKAGTPVVLVVMLRASGMSMMVPVTARLTASVVGMFFGVVVASLGEVRFSALGFAAMACSEIAAGVRCILEERLLTQIDPPMDVLETLYMLAPACVLWQTLIAVAAKLMSAEQDHVVDSPETSVAEHRWLVCLIALSCLLGVAVNASSLLVIQSRSSLFMKSVVLVRNVGLVLYGVGWYNEQVTAVELLGYSCTLGCFAWYNHERQRAMAESSNESDASKRKQQ